MESSAFQLSRIFGQGWNAAKKWLAEHDRDPNPTQAARLNPHDALEEKARWSAGFDAGLVSRTGGHAMANRRSTRRDSARSAGRSVGRSA